MNWSRSARAYEIALSLHVRAASIPKREFHADDVNPVLGFTLRQDEALRDFQAVGIFARKDRLPLAGSVCIVKPPQASAGVSPTAPIGIVRLPLRKTGCSFSTKVQQEDRSFDASLVVAEDVFSA